MPWNEPGNQNDKDRDPWTGKQRTNDDFDPEEVLNRLNQRIKGVFGGSGGSSGGDDISGKAFSGLLILAILAWLATGFYVVDAGQQGVVQRFGAYQASKNPGLNWHLPWPIEGVVKVDVDNTRRVKDRSTMLTKDENIVDIDINVQYRIKNVRDYLFNVYQVDSEQNPAAGTVYQTMRSALRDVVGNNPMDDVLVGTQRELIAVQTQELMQEILNGYEAGVQVLKVNLNEAQAPEAVKEAFDDVVRSREDQERFENEAERYSNRILPDARGKSARILEEANAYRERAIARAQGDAARFTQLAEEYRKAPNVTRERLYLETMESVLSKTKKVLIDSPSSNNLLYMPLNNSGGTGRNDLSNPPPNPAAVQQMLENRQLQNSNGTGNRTTQRATSRESR